MKTRRAQVRVRRGINAAGAGKQTIGLGSKSENLIFVIFKLPPMLVGIKFYKCYD